MLTTSSSVILLISEAVLYKNGFEDDKIKIAAIFRNGTLGDQQWLEMQMRRGGYGSAELPF